MTQRWIRMHEGDVIEVPLGEGWLAYARTYEDLCYCPYQLVSRTRPALASIVASGLHGDVVTVFEYQTQCGAWPRIGNHRIVEGADAGSSPVIDGDQITTRGDRRKLRTDEMERDRRFREEGFIDYLRQELTELGPIARSPLENSVDSDDAIDPQMSVDRNDVAEQVILQYEELIGDGVSPKKAIQKTIKFFEDSFDDSDYEPHIWLALAVIGLRDDCLTPTVRKKALDVIESGRCWWVVENVEPESQRAAALEERKEAIAKLLKQLKPE